MDRKVRIAIAGTGFGAKYALGLQANPDVTLVGVFSRRSERAAEMAERFGIPFYTRHFHELLALPALDAVAVVTPNSTHAEYVRAALRAGKHVICDKPLALTGAQAQSLCQEAEARGLRHVTFVPYRFSPASLAVKEAMNQDTLGRIIGVRASWGVDLRAEPLRWRFQRELSGPGVVSDLGSHVLDLVMWWTGRVRRALGRCRTLVSQRPAVAGGRLRPVDVPDECYALFEFTDAGVGSAAFSWNAKHDQHVEIEAERGTLIYHSPSLLQWLEGKGPFHPVVTFVSRSASRRTSELSLPGMEHFAAQEQALSHMFADIIAYLRGGQKTPCIATFRDGLAVLRVIDAVMASHEIGGWIDVETVPVAPASD